MNFYKTQNLEKYPDGYLRQCKSCLTMHVDNWDPSTYVWILQECDVPYVPKEWDKLMETYAKDKTQVTGTTIIGRYLAKMQLRQWKDFRWKDTQFLQELEDKKTKEAMLRQNYSAAAIKEVIDEQRATIPETENVEIPDFSKYENSSSSSSGYEDYFDKQDPLPDQTFDLTDEDRLALRLKWGKSYRPEEWVRLEQLYQEMENSYDISGAGHEDILKLVCKTSLKANQLLDIGDVDGAQKMVKMYDSLMKSGKFTAAQNKADNGEFLDSISELVAMCESEGYIERYYVDQPKDRVDETIQDLKDYTRSLITNEMNLGNLIENAVKEMANQEAKEEDTDDEDEELSLEQVDELKDKDFEDFNNFVEEEEIADEDLLKQLKESERI